MGLNWLWCGICAKYLTFGTYPTSTVGALIQINSKFNSIRPKDSSEFGPRHPKYLKYKILREYVFTDLLLYN